MVSRRSFVAALMAQIGDALVVTGLGSPTWDVFAAGERVENFHLWGAMGASAPLALGLSPAQPSRSVVAVTGDGEMLMGIGSLATIAAQAPPNLTIVVLDNGHYGETGMQRSHTSLGTDLVAVASGFGISAFATSEPGEVAARVTARAATAFAVVRVEADDPPRTMPPRDGVANKNAFRAALGLPTF
jgi:thiamine pyrophosphate-dependent acetolactate synthase large subunit-like protein